MLFYRAALPLSPDPKGYQGAAHAKIPYRGRGKPESRFMPGRWACGCSVDWRSAIRLRRSGVKHGMEYVQPGVARAQPKVPFSQMII
jgi:hypothetical protein